MSLGPIYYGGPSGLPQVAGSDPQLPPHALEPPVFSFATVISLLHVFMKPWETPRHKKRWQTAMQEARVNLDVPQVFYVDAVEPLAPNSTVSALDDMHWFPSTTIDPLAPAPPAPGDYSIVDVEDVAPPTYTHQRLENVLVYAAAFFVTIVISLLLLCPAQKSPEATNLTESELPDQESPLSFLKRFYDEYTAPFTDKITVDISSIRADIERLTISVADVRSDSALGDEAQRNFFKSLFDGVKDDIAALGDNFESLKGTVHTIKTSADNSMGAEANVISDVKKILDTHDTAIKSVLASTTVQSGAIAAIEETIKTQTNTVNSVADHAVAIAAMEETIKAHCNNLNRLTDHSSALEETLKAQRNALDTVADHSSVIEEIKETLKAQQSSLNSLTEYSSTIASIEETLKTHGTTLESVLGQCSTIADMKNKLDGHVDNVRVTADILTKHSEAAESGQNKLKALEDTIARLETRVEQQNVKLKEYHDESADQNKLKALQDTIARLEKKVEEQDVKLKEYHGESAGQRTKIQSVKEMVESHIATVKSAEEAAASRSNRVDEHGKTLKQVQAKLDSQQLRLSTIQNDLLGQTADLASLRDSAEAHKTHCPSIETQQQEMLESDEESIKMHGDDITKLKEAAREDHNKIESLQEMLESDEESIKMHGNDITKLKEAAREDHNKIESLQEKLETIGKELRELEKRQGEIKKYRERAIKELRSPTNCFIPHAVQEAFDMRIANAVREDNVDDRHLPADDAYGFLVAKLHTLQTQVRELNPPKLTLRYATPAATAKYGPLVHPGQSPMMPPAYPARHPMEPQQPTQSPRGPTPPTPHYQKPNFANVEPFSAYNRGSDDET